MGTGHLFKQKLVSLNRDPHRYGQDPLTYRLCTQNTALAPLLNAKSHSVHRGRLFTRVTTSFYNQIHICKIQLVNELYLYFILLSTN